MARPQAVTLLNQLSVWIIGTRIRSRALLYLYKAGIVSGFGRGHIILTNLPLQYFFQVVLFTFYRNLVGVFPYLRGRNVVHLLIAIPFESSPVFNPLNNSS